LTVAFDSQDSLSNIRHDAFMEAAVLDPSSTIDTFSFAPVDQPTNCITKEDNYKHMQENCCASNEDRKDPLVPFLFDPNLNCASP
jgi:hypothetical protein